MKHNLILLLLLLSFGLSAQQPVPVGKGASPIPNPQSTTNNQQTYAVVVGISDYRDERIPDLNYAHKDAEAFAAYLQSPAGGELPTENIQLLTNEMATTGQMVAAMGWLVEESQPGDKAVIYFSGHGDVERISKFQRGYLLTHDSPPNNYMAGAFPIFGLQDIISTLSEMEVQVVMISDACRAGKLAGSNIGGTQATSVVLAQQFANEIKILSCQPEEFSLEGEQWGGGRGCFSYHLLDGLYGLADGNTDEKINLLEIGRYLEDKVMTEAAPHSQIPMTVGSKTAVIADIDKAYLEKKLADKRSQQPNLAGIKSKGMEDLVLENADTNIQQLYQDFLTAIENGNLMEPAGQSANDYYDLLIQKKSIVKLHGFMRRNFAAALQDESQQALHDYFYDTDKYFSEYVHTKQKTSENYDRYLERAIELLGKDHYMYPLLRVRQLYFYSINKLENADDTLFDEAKTTVIDSLLYALQYDSSAAFVYKTLGDLHKNDSLVAIQYYDRAKTVAPDWPQLYVDIGMYYRSLANYPQAAFHFKKAIGLDSTFIAAYRFLGWVNPIIENQRFTVPNTIAIIEGMLEKEEDILPYYYLILGEAYWLLAGNFGDYAGINNGKAEALMKTAIDKMGDNVLRAHILLGQIYYHSKKYDKAIEEYQYVIDHPEAKAMHMTETLLYQAKIYKYIYKDCQKAEELYFKRFDYFEPHEIHFIAGNFESLLLLYIGCFKDNEKAFQMVDSLKKIQPDYLNFLDLLDIRDYYDISMLFLEKGMMADFEEAIQAGIRQHPNNNNILFYRNAYLYSLANQSDKAIQQLETAIQKGYNDYDNIQKDTDLDNIRNTPEFKALMKKYFPDHSKN